MAAPPVSPAGIDQVYQIVKFQPADRIEFGRLQDACRACPCSRVRFILMEGCWTGLTENWIFRSLGLIDRILGPLSGYPASFGAFIRLVFGNQAVRMAVGLIPETRDQSWGCQLVWMGRSHWSCLGCCPVWTGSSVTYLTNDCASSIWMKQADTSGKLLKIG
jgi:hypothetical protein